jgi:hypothetical protein
MELEEQKRSQSQNGFLLERPSESEILFNIYIVPFPFA